MGGRHTFCKDWMLIELRNDKHKISKNKFLMDTLYIYNDHTPPHFGHFFMLGWVAHSDVSNGKRGGKIEMN